MQRASVALFLALACLSCRKAVETRPPDAVPPSAADATEAPAPAPTAPAADAAPAPDAAGPDAPPPPATPEVVDAGGDASCLLQLSLDQGSSYLQEVRGRLSGDLPDWVGAFPALAVDPAQRQALETANTIRIGDEPLLWWASASGQVFVDARWFSDLVAVDVPRLSAGERQVLGTFKGRGQNVLPPRTLVEFLLRAGVLQTFWHIGAELCLTAETDADGTYRAIFDGAHSYFTSGEHREEYRFAVTVGPDGELAVERL
ncbi:MAG: hypothetical protein HY905_18715 [Deltaproteobacteria bacterium]|nr:hypothetical protein [Deltaproteobacteria bacterium]